MRAVFIVGTDHRYQRGAAFGIPDDVFAQFRTQLEHLIKKHKIQGIAEEMSLDGMGVHRSRGGSLGFYIARDQGLPHEYCDPSREKQKELGITSDSNREKYWLEQLRNSSGFPCLFILGSNHTASFADLLRQSGFEAVVLIANWKPKSWVEEEPP